MRGIGHVVKVAIGLAFAWIIAIAILNIDTFSTTSTNTPLSVSIKGLVTVLAGLLTARGYFGLSADVISTNPKWTALRAKTADWILRGCFATIVIMICYWYLVTQFLDMAAQYIGGHAHTYQGRVSNIDPVTTSRARCRTKMTVIRQPETVSITFCLVRSDAPSLGPLQLAYGDPVLVRMRTNLLGEVVDSVSYDRQRGQTQAHE